MRIEYRCPRCGFLRREAVLDLDDWQPAGECCPACGCPDLVATVVGQGSVK